MPTFLDNIKYYDTDGDLCDIENQINKKAVYIEGSGTAAVTTNPYSCSKWVGACKEVKSLQTGQLVWYKVPVAGNSSYGTSLNINNLGEHPVVANVNTMVGTRYAVGCILPLIYDADGTGSLYLNSASATTVTGVWKIADYDTNTTITYGTLAYYFRPYTAAKLSPYQLGFLNKDNKFVPICSNEFPLYASATTYAKDAIVFEGSYGVYKSLQASNKGHAPHSYSAWWEKLTTPHTPTTLSFRPDKCYWYNTTTTVNANAVIGGNTLMTVGYNATNMPAANFNASLPTYRIIYLCGTYDTTTGLFTLNGGGTAGSTAYYTFVPDNTSNITLSSYFTAGKDYILVGASYSTANYMYLREDNLLFHFDGTNLVPYDTYRANTISSAIPSNTSDLTNDSGFITDAGVTSVSLVSGTNNGTLKLTVNGSSTDNIAVKGLGTAAYKADSYFGTATAVSAAQSTADTAKSIAEGRAKAVSFATVAAMKTALAAASATEYKVGDNLFIVATDVPDYWVSKVNATQSGDYGYYEVSELETQKVDLTDYQTKTDNSLATTAKTIVGAINELNSDKADASDIPDVSDMVTKSGSQTISGTKTFDSTDTYISGFGVSKTNNLGSIGYYAFVRANSSNSLFGLRYGSTIYYLQANASGLHLGPSDAATTWASNGDMTIQGTNRPKWKTSNLALQSEIPTVDGFVSDSSHNAVSNAAITGYVDENKSTIHEPSTTTAIYNATYDAYICEADAETFHEGKHSIFVVYFSAGAEPDLTKPIYIVNTLDNSMVARIVTPTTLFSQGTPISILAKQCYYAYPYVGSEKAVLSFTGTMTQFLREDWDIIVDTPNLSNLPEASTSTAGVVTTGSQTFAGIKTFNSGIHIAGTISGNTYSIEQPANPLTGVMSYTLTPPEKSGTIATTDQTIQELTTQSVRVWDLNSGIYKWTYTGTGTLYYNGTTNITNYLSLFGTGGGTAIIEITPASIGGIAVKSFKVSYASTTGNNTISFGISSASGGSVNTRALSNIPTATTSSVTSGSSALVTSGGVYDYVKNPAYSSAQYSLGFYYGLMGATITSINNATYLQPGEFACNVSTSCTGMPYTPSDARKILLKTTMSYYGPHSTYTPTIKQELTVFTDNRTFVRYITYASASSITYGAWQETTPNKMSLSGSTLYITF